MTDQFTGKNYLVIGGASGIGREISLNLHRLGASVTITSRKKLSDPVFSGMSSYELDPLTDRNDSGWIPDPLHGLVYCPGTIHLKPVQRITPDDLLHDFNVNAVGAFRMISASLKKLKAASGASIVLFSTVAVQTGMSYHVSVAAAKGAVEGMARSLAAELASSQIRVNVLAPSLTDTPLASPLLSTPEKKEAAAKRHPLGRFGNPADIASAALFLLSGQSSWITGQIIGVDGGLSTLRPL